jgi:hypothetical protein
MKKMNREELLGELNNIYTRANNFFEKAYQTLGGKRVSAISFDFGYTSDELWNQLPMQLKEESSEVVSKLMEMAPVVAETARMTTYLTQADQIQLGHAIKGMRSALRLRLYSHWDVQVLHDEGTVLGVQSEGYNDDDGVYPEDALKHFENCYRKLHDIVEVSSSEIIKHAEQTLESRGQASSNFRPDTAFIMMWMDPNKPDLEDVYNTVRRCFDEFGIDAERADDIEHEGLITEEIIDKIRSSEFLFADLTGARPSVYYEVGFAHAIRKRVILYRQAGERIHFDLAGYNCPEYINLSDLEKKLNKRLLHLTGKNIAKAENK